MRISLIVAASENGVIGKDKKMPWHLPADLRYFKNLTSGHSIIMGRKTHESIGRALPKRRNIVLSRDKSLQLPGCEVAHSLGEALKSCIGEKEVFIIGGGSIYEKALDLDMVERIYLTIVHGEFEGDTFFEVPQMKKWKLVSAEKHLADEKNTWNYTFEVRERA